MLMLLKISYVKFTFSVKHWYEAYIFNLEFQLEGLFDPEYTMCDELYVILI